MRALVSAAVFVGTIAVSAQELWQTTQDRSSPDERFVVRWTTDHPEQDHRAIELLRRADGTVLFEHRTNGRYTNAAWNQQSTRCLLFDAPDNANTYFWVFRVQGDRVTTEQLDYDAMSRQIEATIPRARTRDDQPGRSGVEKISWTSQSELSIELLYNAVPVFVTVDVSTPDRPKVRAADP